VDTLSRDGLRILATDRGGIWVSLYLPTHPSGPETQQNPIRFNNLLREAEAQIVAQGTRPAEARALLSSAERLAADSDFWRHQSHGLAVFVSQRGQRAFRLPLPFETLAVVSDRPHIQPLLPIFTATGPFYILALSLNAVRLFHATAHHVAEVPLVGVPLSLAEAMKYDEVEKSHHMRSPISFSGPKVGHGHEIDEKDRILRFSQQVSHGLHAVLRESQAPLVLAAVDYLMAIYREVNSYPHLLPDGVIGSPDALSAEALHQRAYAIVEPEFRRGRADALARYRQLAGTGGTAGSVEEAVRAAAEGRVDTLFVVAGKHLWGTFNPDTLAVTRHDRAEPGDEDLLDLAAAETLLTGGTVHTVSMDEVGAGTAVAAVLRY